MSTVASPQLALQVELSDAATLENFLEREALAPLLFAARRPLSEALTYLHGTEGAGKSHLLQAVCHGVPGSVYLPLAELRALPAQQLLADLEASPLLAIDDLDAVAGDSSWEESLFHLYNRAQAAGCVLWIAARHPAADLSVVLPDLVSRLASGVTWGLGDSTDEEKAAILCFRAQRRGIPMNEAVAAYLCSRGERSLHALLATLERLGQASLELKRPLTLPLVKSVMGW